MQTELRQLMELPPGVFCFTFEDRCDASALHRPSFITPFAVVIRLDLLTVVMIGPEGTLYQDCPFVFDVCLPQDYPQG